MKRALLAAATLLAGVASGSGAALGVHAWVGPDHSSGRATPEAEKDMVFVPAGSILTPLVFPDGSLAGYASIDVQFEVPASEGERVKQRLPLLLHAVNLQTYRTPLAAGPDGSLPDLERFRTLVAGAAGQVFGRGTVRRLAITQARPA